MLNGKCLIAVDERQCKIRVVERLSEFHHAIWTTASPAELLGVPNGSSFLPKPVDLKFEQAADKAGSPRLSTTITVGGADDSSGGQEPLSAHDELASADSTTASLLGLDDSTIETLSDQDLEQLSEKLLERVVRQLVTVAHTSEELLEELNSLDEAGLSLLHYVSFYNYSTLVPLLLSHGAQINQQSTQGQSALHLAAGCGHKEVVEVLVQSGADMFALDFDGFTPADRADKSEHSEVAVFLRRLMGSQDADSNGERRMTRERSSFQAAVTDAFAMEIDFGGENFDTMDDSVDMMIEFGSQSSNCDSPGESSGGGKSKNYVRGLGDAMLVCPCV